MMIPESHINSSSPATIIWLDKEALYHFSHIQDYSFKLTDPSNFLSIKEIRDQVLLKRKIPLKQLIATVGKILHNNKIKVINIHGRVKGVYSTYVKMRRYGMDIDRIYDLVAMRIIVGDIDSCYKTLAALHTIYPPLPCRLKDYIANPKYNGYESLHTSVYAEDGTPFEIQVRTCQMHTIAEVGSASHWLYDQEKEDKVGISLPLGRKYLENLHDLQQDIRVQPLPARHESREVSTGDNSYPPF